MTTFSLGWFKLYTQARCAPRRLHFLHTSTAHFFTLPNGAGAHPPDCCRWYDNLTMSMGIQDGDALALAWIINLLPCCWTRAGRCTHDFVDSAKDLLDAAAAINPDLANDTTPNSRKAAGVMAFLVTTISSSFLLLPPALPLMVALVPPQICFRGRLSALCMLPLSLLIAPLCSAPHTSRGTV